MVADVLVVPGDLRLDIVKLLIECTGLLGLAFGPVGFDVPPKRGTLLSSTETGLGSIDGDTAHNRCLSVFYRLFILKTLSYTWSAIS